VGGPEELCFSRRRGLPTTTTPSCRNSKQYRQDRIQSTFDAGVRRIDFRPTVALDDHVIPTEAIVVDRDDGRYAIDFVDARPEGDPLGEGLLQ